MLLSSGFFLLLLQKWSCLHHSRCMCLFHKLVFYKKRINAQDHVNNAVQQRRDSSFLMPKIVVKFERGQPNGGAAGTVRVYVSVHKSVFY